MKICPNCNKTYGDSMVYCTVCGTKLVDNQVNANQNNVNITPRTPGNSGSIPQQGGITCWLPLILSIVGVLVWWNFSAWAGMILSILGAIMGLSSEYKFIKGICIVVCIIVVLGTIFLL